MDKVTIITVTHDAPRFVDLCVRAVRQRTPEDHVHVIIDNGSQRPTISTLEQRAKDGWIKLHKRKTHKNSGGHALALEWYLYQLKEASPLVCLLDSDAYPTREGWLTGLYNRMTDNQADAIGCVHFRNDKLLHPSCMLFKYQDLLNSGNPSFKIKKTTEYFNDTGMIVCEAMIKKGYKLLPLSREEMTEFYSHRWRGTRAENAKGQFLDDQLLSAYHRETALWFEHPNARF